MSDNPSHCFDCESGTYDEVKTIYTVKLPEGDSFEIPDLVMLRCNKCGDEIFPSVSSDRIDTEIDAYQDTVTPELLVEFLKQFDLNQKEAAELLGLGEKTFHRWLKDHQRVSRSMGYFIRLVMKHPDAYESLEQRSWRQKSDVMC